jgi:hypothetical protein
VELQTSESLAINVFFLLTLFLELLGDVTTDSLINFRVKAGSAAALVIAIISDAT